MGCYVGNLIAENISHNRPAAAAAAVQPFEYRHAGSFSYVGDGSAVMEVDLPVIGKVVLKGLAPDTLLADPPWLLKHAWVTCLQARRRWRCGAAATCQSRCVHALPARAYACVVDDTASLLSLSPPPSSPPPQVSLRTTALIALDWTKVLLFGRWATNPSPHSVSFRFCFLKCSAGRCQSRREQVRIGKDFTARWRQQQQHPHQRQQHQQLHQRRRRLMEKFEC